METEGPFIKVPIECVSQVFRKTRKTVTQELTAVIREVNSLAAVEAAAQETGAACGEINDVSAKLDELLYRLAKLKEMAQEAAREEKQHLHGLTERLLLLAQPPPPPPPPPTTSSSPASASTTESPGEKTRLDRCIVEYLLREGHTEAARELSEEAGIQDYVTIELFERAKHVEAAIRAKDVGPALRWCEDNASRLRKLESNLDFRIRERVLLEMIRAQRKDEAVEYAQECLDTRAEIHGAVIQRAMGTLAFKDPASAPIPEVAALFADERWDELASEFLTEMQRVFGLTQPSMLEIILQGGLSVVKTPQCSEDDNRLGHCPTCSAEGRALGEGLPCAHHGQSFLICRQSGEPIGPENPPVALPNGRVFGSRAISALARPSAAVSTVGAGVGIGAGPTSGLAGSSLVTCPSTGKKFRFEDLRSVFII